MSDYSVTIYVDQGSFTGDGGLPFTPTFFTGHTFIDLNSPDGSETSGFYGSEENGWDGITKPGEVRNDSWRIGKAVLVYCCLA